LSEGKKELKEISLDLLSEPEEQIRTVILEEGLNDLAESIKLNGVIEPLIVVRKDNKYEVCAGHRRFLAARIAGLATVPCVVWDLSSREAACVKLHENCFRENVNPVDEGRYFLGLHEDENLSFGEIARLANRSEAYVYRRVNLVGGNERVVAALEAGLINFSQACEINKVEDERIVNELLRITIDSGATASTLRGMRYDFGRMDRGRGVSEIDYNTDGINYKEAKHLINCPVCSGAYPVSEIYPISVCKTCYDNFLRALTGGAGG